MANSGQGTPPPAWIDDGDEMEEDQMLREWFAQQELGGVARLEETAKHILQLVIGVFSVLIAVLLLADSPAYLEDATVRYYGVTSVYLFFTSLAAASLVVIPIPSGSYQPNNLSQMHRIYKWLLIGKMICLYVSLGFFVAGSAYFGWLIIRALS